MALLQGRLEARRQARRPRVKTYGRDEVVQLKDPGCSQNSSQAEVSPGRIYFRSLKPVHNLSCFSIDSDNIESTGLG